MAVLVNEERERFEAFEANMAWFLTNYELLKKSYAGEYVAINKSGVVDHARDLLVLVKRLRKKYDDLSSFVIEPVSEKKVSFVL